MSDTGAARPAARLGAQLRETRRGLGWELPDLAASLRIRREYLEAIEDGRMADLPGTTYALGFVRAYASALGLSGDEVAARVRSEAEEVNRKPPLSFPAPVPQRGVPAGALMLLGVVILAGSYTGWYWWTEHRRTPVETVPAVPDRFSPAIASKPAPSPQVASILPSAAPSEPPPAAAVTPAQPASPAPRTGQPAAPTVAAPAPDAAKPVATVQPSTPVARVADAPPGAPPAGAPGGTRVTIRATADAWVSIKDNQGRKVLDRLMHAGDSYPVPADPPGLLLTTGNAGGTELDVDGAPVAGMGGSGMVRRNLPLDADALKAGLPPLGRVKHS